MCCEAEVLIIMEKRDIQCWQIISSCGNDSYIRYISFLYIWHLACLSCGRYIYVNICCCCYLNADDITHQVIQMTKTLFPHSKLKAIRDSIYNSPPSWRRRRLLPACRMVSCSVMQDTVTVSGWRWLLPHLISPSRRRFPELNTSNCETDQSHQALLSAAFIHSWRSNSSIENFFHPISF